MSVVSKKWPPTSIRLQAFTESRTKELEKLGFTVIDNVFGQEFIKNLREEICFLHATGELRNNRTYYSPAKTSTVSNGGVSFSFSVSKPHILEAEPPFSQHAEFLSFFHSYSTSHLLPLLNERLGYLYLDSIDLKIQFNEGKGGCFPLHVDTSQQVSNRQLTMLLYLNEGWSKEDGGSFRLYPFPYQPVDVPPLADRVVMFHSMEMVHRVLPSNKPRYCVTLWLKGSRVTEKTDLTWLRGIKEIQFLLNPLNRIPLTKLLYAQEWAKSIGEAFGGIEDENQNKTEINGLLHKHREEVAFIEARLGASLVNFVRKSLPLGHCDNFQTHCSFLSDLKGYED